MGERRGTKALELWCRRITDGYPGVKVENMTTSWRDGLAFCALIHHFRPDLIDFSSLRAGDVYRNNALAFRTAEQCLGIPALLDAEDMVAYEVPDRLSILTYLSQFYQYFAHQGARGGRPSLKRTSASPTTAAVVESPPPAKVPAGVGRRLEPCVKCGHPVFLAERLVVPVGSGSSEGPRTSSLYHRGCFRCARCDAQLSLADCYETIDGLWCCETCPDELDTSNSLPPPLPLSPPPSPEQMSSIMSTSTTSSTPFKNTSTNDIDTIENSKVSVSELRNNFESTKDENDSTDERDDNNNDDDDDDDDGGGGGSLVQRRMKLFEKQQILITTKPLPLVRKLSDSTQTKIDPGGEIDKEGEQLESRKQESDIENLETEQKTEQESVDNSVKRHSEYEHSSLVFENSECELKSENVIESCEMDNKEVKTELEKKEEKSDNIKTDENTIILEESKTVESEHIDLESKIEKEEEIKVEEQEEQLKTDEETTTEPETSITSSAIKEGQSDIYPEELNPFGSEDDEEEEKTKRANQSSADKTKSPPPRPPPPNLSKRIVIPAPKVNLNPFWSDDEGPSSEDDDAAIPTPPVPKPRTMKSQNVTSEPSPAPRRSLPAPSTLSPMSIYGSVSSLSSLASSGGGGGSTARRKKKPAPAPPSVRELFPETPVNTQSAESSRTSSPTSMNVIGGVSPKPRRHRKARPAPLPPSQMGSDPHDSSSWERQKSDKDQANLHRQSHSESTLQEITALSAPDKSTYGQWKRKKGPAPPRPVPQRRQIRVMPIKEVQRELDDIEVKQQELERQGVNLEQTIRSKFEESNLTEDDSNMTPDVEDLVLHLFELVNEKNELFRRQAELMYLRRQQRLEEEHAELEYQIRLLLEKPEHSKTDSEKACEEELIQRLVDVVERRNEIIECLDMDRRREADEDRSIHARLEQFGSASKHNLQNPGSGADTLKSKTSSSSGSSTSKKEKKLFGKKDKKKKKEKEKEKTFIDVDKDIDELETVEVIIKEKKEKKKWF